MLIGELSARSGASRRSLRYYEQHGLINAQRGPNGYRSYDDTALATVGKIKALLGAGLPLDTVRDLLPCTLDATPNVQPCPSLVETLRSEIARLDTQAATILTCRDEIAGILDRSAAPHSAPSSSKSRMRAPDRQSPRAGRHSEDQQTPVRPR